jgi:hypothetical protein
MLALAQLSLLGTYTRDFETNEGPMDLDPSSHRRGLKRLRRKRRKRNLPENDPTDKLHFPEAEREP